MATAFPALRVRSVPTRHAEQDEDSDQGQTEERVVLFGSIDERESLRSDSSLSSDNAPITLNSSLFPSHSNGHFTAMNESLLLSETPSIYASASELHRNSSYSTTSSDHSSAIQPRDSDYSTVSRPSFSSSELGSSWALTEEALSTLPRSNQSRRPSSVVFTSDSSEDESLPGPSTTPRRSRLINRRTVDQIRPNDDNLEHNPFAESAGIRDKLRPTSSEDKSHSTHSQNSYPTPPPDSLRKQKGSKRRHRTSGRVSGSQKKSSASGSARVQNDARSSQVEEELGKPGEAFMRSQRESQARRNVEERVFLGGLLAKLADIDTLELIATTPSSTTHSRALRNTRDRSIAAAYPSSSIEAHGFAKLSSEARDQLHLRAPPTRMDLDDASGDETETELNVMSTSAGAWYRDRSVGRHAPADSLQISRSISLSSIPFYLLEVMNPLSSYSSSPSLVELSNETQLSSHATRHSLRRSNSDTSSRSGSVGRKCKVSDSGLGEPWGADFDGLEGAISYWRRILRSLRGY